MSKKEISFKDGAIIASSLVFMLVIYAPLELYFNNQSEFWFDIYMLFPVMFIFAIGILIIGLGIFGLIYKMNKKIFLFLSAFLVYIFCGAYIQGNYLIKHLPPLDGAWIDWSKYPKEHIKSLILWIGLFLLVFLLCKKVGMKKFVSVAKYLVIGISGVLFLTMISLCIMTKGYEKKSNYTVSDKYQFQMSTDENVIIFLLDALSGDTWKNVYQNHPEYDEVFEDFTFFEDTVGAYNNTKHAIPFIFSGEWFENDEKFENYEERAYLENPLFDRLENEGYRLGMYEEFMPTSESGYGRFENIIPSKRGCKDYFSFIRWNLVMVNLRYAPFDLKRLGFVNSDRFNTIKLDPEGAHTFSWKNEIYYKDLKDTPITYTDDKCFKFTHILGAHLPHEYDINVNIIPPEEGSYEKNIEAAMTITATYINKLREANVYDNSVIIVLADHGYTDDGMQYRQNPILFMKGKNEKHPFAVSEKPVSYNGLKSAYMNLLDGRTSEESMPEEHERRYIYYEYMKEDHMWECIQHGKASDRKTLEKTGNEYIVK